MRRLALAFVALVLMASCAGETASSAIDLDLYEFGITPSSTVFETGTVDLRATNSGRFAHTIVITDPSGSVVAASDLIPPGETITMTIDLAEGGYEISCRIVSTSPDDELFDHYEQGMIAEITSG